MEQQTTKDMKWVNLFAGNRLAARGMSLSYIPPVIKEGEKITQLNQAELEKGTAKWKQAAILYVMGATPSIGALERYIAVKWNFTAKPKIYLHNDGYFLLKFNTLEVRDEVLYSVPHTINNKPIIIKPWKANFNFDEEVLRMVPLWVQFPELPLNCWELETLSRISSVLRNQVYADECTSRVERISFARVLVEIDVTVPLPRMIKVQGPTGRNFEQEVWYDWVLDYCEVCLQVGHGCNNSYESQIPEQKQKHKEKPVKKVIPKNQVMEWKAKQGTGLVVHT
ncbi:PREDICTED: uncharacterized protein LOC109240928 [Nicotiana attenuata]|uniref:uncharacterized protein LOC109240928 n=1 Tax=Nicotiana attenuata TaxID=49451 RepID=UPI0009047715|nr:PREDICTED: uncharacterized protein LOC109240928 [Nicotiana attenuata]